MNRDIQIGVSVIICCYNSAERLPQTLKHISKQNVSSNIVWEVIVVNNNSTDNTKSVALEEWKKYNCSAEFRIVDQPTSGLSFARERGIEVSQYEYLLFCDDDNWLCDSYVERAHKILNENKDVALVGGCGEYVCEENPPKWFNEFSGPYAVGKQLDKTGIARIKGTFYGAGAIIRKTDYKKLEAEGFKFMLSGRKGKKMLTGEDRELCYAFTLNRKKLFYDSELRFKHFIPRTRSTFRYYKNMMYNYVPASIILNCYYLHVCNTLMHRSSMKNSFSWNFVMTIFLNTKNFCVRIIPNIKKGYWEFILLDFLIIFKYIVFWTLNYKQFVTSYHTIKNAKYNKK